MDSLHKPRGAAQHQSDAHGKPRPESMRYMDFAETATWIYGSPRAVLLALGKLVWATGMVGGCSKGERYLYAKTIMTRAGIRDGEAFAAAVRRLEGHGVLKVKEGTKLPGQVKPPPRLYRIIVPPDWVYVDVDGKEHSYGGNTA